MSRTWLLVPLLALYLFHLGGAGFGLDPDEPRYASIGREMAQSGDWITPRLNGSPWFEKPPLLYWMTALATKLGFRDEWAARLPVALVSIAFLAFFFSIVEQEFSTAIAAMATAILGTSAGWLAYSFSAVTDLPMSAAFNTAMLTALFDTRRRQAAGWIAGVMLGLAILAKAFLPVVLFFPIWLIARGKRLAIIAGALLVSAPWHLLVWLRNGSAFWKVYFWQQQVGRASSAILPHPQPFWFYFPILLVGLFPWTPLFGLLARRKPYDDLRVTSLLIWLGLALLFLSLVPNKLPGYLLPLIPGVAIVLAAALDKGTQQQWWIGACALLLALTPAIAHSLPDAFLAGFSHTRWTLTFAGWPFALGAAIAWWLAYRKQTSLAVLAAALTAALAAAYLKASALPELDQRVAVRAFWIVHKTGIENACIDPGVRRAATFGLDYYVGRGLPECPPVPVPLRIASSKEGLALVSKTP